MLFAIIILWLVWLWSHLVGLAIGYGTYCECRELGRSHESSSAWAVFGVLLFAVYCRYFIPGGYFE